MSATEYAAKFVELAKFYPHYTPETAEFSKCIKFENGLRASWVLYRPSCYLFTFDLFRVLFMISNKYC